MKSLSPWLMLLVFVVAGCIGSPEPHNPMTKPDKAKVEKVVITPTSVKCLRCDRKDTTKNNPYLTDEEKKILKRTEEDLDDLEWGVEKKEKRKAY